MEVLCVHVLLLSKNVWQESGEALFCVEIAEKRSSLFIPIKIDYAKDSTR